MFSNTPGGTGSVWVIQTVDSAAEWVGWGGMEFPGIGCRWEPHISYYDDTPAALKYARWDGSAWLTQTVSNAGGHFNSLALDSDGNPRIAYYLMGGALEYAWDGSAWLTQTVDGDGGLWISLALDAAGNPSIGYSDNFVVNYARLDGGIWTSQSVMGFDLGGSVSLAMDSAGNPHISSHVFGLYGGDLMYAVRVQRYNLYLPLVFRNGG